jgi:intracellular multiplication protein IcmX
MKQLRKTIQIISLSTSLLTLAYAEGETPAYSSESSGASQDDNITTLRKHVDNLGGFLGFLIANPSPNIQDKESKYNAQLLNLDQMQKGQNALVSQLFSASVINATFNTFFSGSPYQALNSLSNTGFNQNNFTQPKIDAPTQTEQPISPVTQLLLNQLSATPDDFCYEQQNNNPSRYNWRKDCPYPFTASLYLAHELGLNVDSASFAPSNSRYRYNDFTSFGDSLTPSIFYPTKSTDQNNSQNPNLPMLNQVDASLITSPLIYTKDSGTGSQQQNQSQGLIPTTQLQAAQTVARHLSGTTAPAILVSQASISNTLMKIKSANDVKSQLATFRAFGIFMMNLKTYSARMSVGLQNIYNMIGKRLPTQAGSDQASSSQAMNEFTMATYRLYSPPSTDGSTTASNWQTMINNASPMTVQKETVMLLAEINYQLYLMRQQQEQLLLTQSVALLNSLQPPTYAPPSS